MKDEKRRWWCYFFHTPWHKVFSIPGKNFRWWKIECAKCGSHWEEHCD